MSNQNPLVDIELISEMLYQDEKYIKEFAGASMQSFSEFREQFRKYVLARDMEELRRAGHKIKPAALMLNLNVIIDIYEESKTLIEEDAPDAKLHGVADRMDAYCNQILDEFSNIV
ncbi:taurine dioxygenase [Rhodohalobacter mucosus]|nr:taurine dioxygenase [Rhodohalobacter mucosus]